MCIIALLYFTSCVDTKIRYLGYTTGWKYASPKVMSPSDFAAYFKEQKELEEAWDNAITSYWYGHLLSGNRGQVPYYSGAKELDLGPSRLLKCAMIIKNRGFTIHRHAGSWSWFVSSNKDSEFCPEGYISACDIDQLEMELRALTQKTLYRMLNIMRKDMFVHDVYCDRFYPFLSDAIKDTIKSVRVRRKFTDLGGWQMLKPTEGLDEKKGDYFVVYSGDDWFEIPDPNGRGSTHVKVGYAGKYLNAKIVGVKNEKFGIDIYDTNYDKRYNNKMITLTPYDDENCLFMYMKFLCPIANKKMGKDKLVFHEDFVKFKEQVVARETAFVHEFYDKLRSSDNNVKKVMRKYRYQMARYFANIIDAHINDNYKGVDLFLPCNFDEFAANGYTVEYMGEDCFKVTAGGNSVFLKVVLYGKNQTPAIMGVINRVEDIDYCPDRFTWPKSVKE